MTRSSFFNFKGLWTQFLAILAFALVLLGTTSVAQAQDMTASGYTLSPSMGIIFNGKSSMAGIAVGENFGGDGKGTVSTLVDGAIKLGVDAKLSGSNDPECKINCDLTTSTLFAVGEMIAAGRATNQKKEGFGPVTSQMGLNNMMAGEARVMWVSQKFVPLPTPVPLSGTKP